MTEQAKKSTSRRLLLRLSLALVLVSLAASGYLVYLHVRANTDAGYVAACDVNATFRCSEIAISSYSVLLNVPVAVWGLLGYVAFLFFLVGGLRSEGRRSWPVGLYWLLAAATLAVSIVYAVIAEVVIGALCLGCLVLYATNTLLFVLASLLLARERGALWRDLVGLRRNVAVIRFAAVMLVASVVLAGTYPQYWETPLQAECEGVTAGTADDGSCWIGARDPVMEITEFSDYRCPYCRRAHRRLRRLVAKYKDRLRLIHKHFPLDTECNPSLRRQLHAGSCFMARMAYCAGAQGRFWDMNDRLFALQEGHGVPDAAAMAGDLGLNVATFLTCLQSAAAASSVRSDIDEGIRLHVSATPTFIVDGRRYVGQIPDSVLSRLR